MKVGDEKVGKSETDSKLIQNSRRQLAFIFLLEWTNMAIMPKCLD